MPYLFAVIGIIVVFNFYLLFKRSRKSRNIGKDATAQRVAMVKHHDDLVRKLNYEQADAARRVDLRNKTLEMYEQVRRNAEDSDDQAAGPAPSKPDSETKSQNPMSTDHNIEGLK